MMAGGHRGDLDLEVRIWVIMGCIGEITVWNTTIVQLRCSKADNLLRRSVGRRQVQPVVPQPLLVSRGRRGTAVHPVRVHHGRLSQRGDLNGSQGGEPSVLPHGEASERNGEANERSS